MLTYLTEDLQFFNHYSFIIHFVIHKWQGLERWKALQSVQENIEKPRILRFQVLSYKELYNLFSMQMN